MSKIRAWRRSSSNAERNTGWQAGSAAIAWDEELSERQPALLLSMQLEHETVVLQRRCIPRICGPVCWS